MANPIEFLAETKIKFKPSPIEGIGIFAIRDINRGETLFPVWKGKSGNYRLTQLHYDSLSAEVQELLRRYFPNPLYVNLTHNEPLLMKQPNIFMNYSQQTNVSIIANTFIARVDICKGDELVGDFYTP